MHAIYNSSTAFTTIDLQKKPQINLDKKMNNKKSFTKRSECSLSLVETAHFVQ